MWTSEVSQYMPIFWMTKLCVQSYLSLLFPQCFILCMFIFWNNERILLTKHATVRVIHISAIWLWFPEVLSRRLFFNCYSTGFSAISRLMCILFCPEGWVETVNLCFTFKYSRVVLFFLIKCEESSVMNCLQSTHFDVFTGSCIETRNWHVVTKFRWFH